MGENILVDNGWLLHQPRFPERILSLTERETNREWKKQRDALREVYGEYGLYRFSVTSMVDCIYVMNQEGEGRDFSAPCTLPHPL